MRQEENVINKTGKENIKTGERKKSVTGGKKRKVSREKDSEERTKYR